MAGIVVELFHVVDGFKWVGFYRVVATEVLKLGPYQGRHGCVMISIEKGYAAPRSAISKSRLLQMSSNLTGIPRLPRQCNRNWLFQCLSGAII